MARPHVEIDEDQFKKLCGIQCTLDEISAWFKCSPDTIERWCKREFSMGYAEAYKIWSADGKISLRRTQFKLAEKNVAMAIWLGKQYLGQRDNVDMSIETAESAKEVEALNEYFKHRQQEGVS